MAQLIPFDCLKYSHKLLMRNGILMVGSKNDVKKKRLDLIKKGINPTELSIIKTSDEQKRDYLELNNVSVFFTMENWK